MERLLWKSPNPSSPRHRWLPLVIGATLLSGAVARAAVPLLPDSICVNCTVPQVTAVEAMGLDSQFLGLGKAFGSIQPGGGIAPARAAFELPSLMSLSGGATPPATPSWTDRVSAGFLPADFSFAPKPLVDPQSVVWNWGDLAGPFGSYNPQAALYSLWKSPSSPWFGAAQFWSGGGLPAPDLTDLPPFVTASPAR